jgi:hypothetical protein
MPQSTMSSELKELASKIAKEPENLHELYARMQAIWNRPIHRLGMDGATSYE